MRALIQRVSEASVTIDGQVAGSIDRGLLVYVGVAKDDDTSDASYLADKIAGLRIFEDDDGKMNLDVKQVGGAVLAISAFTLYADCRKGRRPGFDQAAGPELAEQLYNELVELLKTAALPVETGRFRQRMYVASVNDGPVLPLVDSRKLL